jgi:hypothetical protein
MIDIIVAMGISILIGAFGVIAWAKCRKQG